jgi:hypothetical protein
MTVFPDLESYLRELLVEGGIQKSALANIAYPKLMIVSNSLSTEIIPKR